MATSPEQHGDVAKALAEHINKRKEESLRLQLLWHVPRFAKGAVAQTRYLFTLTYYMTY